jgi:hypothetical protein
VSIKLCCSRGFVCPMPVEYVPRGDGQKLSSGETKRYLHVRISFFCVLDNFCHRNFNQRQFSRAITSDQKLKFLCQKLSKTKIVSALSGLRLLHRPLDCTIYQVALHHIMHFRFGKSNSPLHHNIERAHPISTFSARNRSIIVHRGANKDQYARNRA